MISKLSLLKSIDLDLRIKNTIFRDITQQQYVSYAYHSNAISVFISLYFSETMKTEVEIAKLNTAITKSVGSNSKTTYRIQNQDIPRAGRVVAPGGAVGRGRARWGANRIILPGDKSQSYPPRHRRNIASTSFQKHEQAKSYLDRRRNKMTG